MTDVFLTGLVLGLLFGGMGGMVWGYRLCRKDMRPLIEDYKKEVRELHTANMERAKRIRDAVEARREEIKKGAR